MQLPELMLGIKKNLMKNTNKIVWITGASSGIGAELAKIYSHRGIKLILSSRNVRALERVKSECYYPENIKILPIDLNDFYAAPDLVKKAYNIFGRIDILINNDKLISLNQSWTMTAVIIAKIIPFKIPIINSLPTTLLKLFEESS